ncbi:MAG: RNA polymerase sigma factor [Nannocystaceae bacterium]|nr:sigma-70 family RNA polymerase sigma factor [bacterium]
MEQERSDGAEESDIREAWDEDAFERAATLALERYGQELLGYLHAMARPPLEPDDLFAELCERLWRKLPDFRWQSSLRTWTYVIARNLLRTGFRSARGPKGRIDPLGSSEISKLADRLRSSTPPHIRTRAKDRLQQIRDGLDPDDQTLLILRIDRTMSWKDIADVMREDDDSRSNSQRAAALRKRFERLKERLRQQMQAGR